MHDFSNHSEIVTGAGGGIGFGTADAFHRAGASIAICDIDETRLTAAMEHEWDRVMETNLRGLFLTCQAAARRMVAEGRPGKIITISSGAHNSGRRGAAHYCASKAGVVMFTKVLAMELGEHRINVNCIAPGLITLERSSDDVSEEVISTIVASIPWGRPGSPADVASAALFLASPDADFITGDVLMVDGGASTGRTHLPYS